MTIGYLYRMLDGDWTLLYVGRTIDPGTRMHRHADEKWWWEQVSMILIERFFDSTTLDLAERRAIATERPRYNKALNDHRQLGGEGRFDEVACPVCGRESFYRGDRDRYFHVWGEDNRECWAAITSGRVEISEIDKFGRPTASVSR